jgi:hypothetical protein
MDMKHGHTAWTCNMDKQHAHAAWEREHGAIDMEYGHEAWTSALACRMDTLNGHA